MALNPRAETINSLLQVVIPDVKSEHIRGSGVVYRSRDLRHEDQRGSPKKTVKDCKLLTNSINGIAPQATQ